MARIITIAQQKGGAGKTTLAAQLVSAWAADGLRVAAIDIDPQGSLTRWFATRQETLGKTAVALTVSGLTGWRMSGEIDRLKRDCDLIVIDSPPHAQTDAKAAIRAADLVVIPIQPSPLDIWATAPTLDLAIKEHVPVLLVLNRFSAKGLATEGALKALEELGQPVAKTRLGNRGGYAASMAEGKSVIETMPGTVAARELIKLAREILAMLPVVKT